MNIVPISAFNDNYIWLIQNGDEAVCVDPGEAQPVQDYVQQHQLQLTAILITHHHRDHIGGVEALCKAHPDITVYGPADIACVNTAVTEGQSLSLLNMDWKVWFVPGHTHNHLAYVLTAQNDASQQHVFCGDTLFSAGCGRVFCGTIEDLYQSIQRFAQMPVNTLFYPAHEYTASNVRFALSVEPSNEYMQQALVQAEQHTPSLPVTLAHEKQINPFMRLDEAEIIESVKAKHLVSASREQIFASLRQLKNEF